MALFTLDIKKGFLQSHHKWTMLNTAVKGV